MLVEGETATRLGVVPKGSIRKREVFYRHVGYPNRVRGEVFDGGWFPYHVNGRTIVVGVIVGHEGGDAWRCAALSNDVLQGRSSVEQHVFGVAVEPNVVGHDTDRVFLSVDERYTIQRGHNGFIHVARVDNGSLRIPFNAGQNPVLWNMVTELHEDGVKGTIVGRAEVP